MNELIKIQARTFGEDETQTVNARELHGFLDSRQDFSNWIKTRIEQYSFAINKDYLLDNFVEQTQSGAKHKIEYYITLDMAKELAMVERNEKGKQARQYFIACEKALKASLPDFSNPAVAARAWADQFEQRRIAEEKVKDLEPKAEFFDAVTSSKNAIDMKTCAKVLDVGLGRNQLFQFLRDQQVLMADNQPYQSYIDSGWFRVIENKWQTEDGETHISFKTLVFQKGLDGIRSLLKRRGTNYLRAI